MKNNARAWDRLRAWSREPASSAVFTDIDGTLAPIAPTPDQAEVPGEIKDLLRSLSRRYLVVAGISGRRTEEALALLGLEEIPYFGNHGFETLQSGRMEIIPEAIPYLSKIEELERLAQEDLGPRGAFVEDKGITASIHFRNAPPEVGERCIEFVRREGERLGLRVTVGRGIVEARPPIRADKGTAVRALVEEYRPRRAMFIGDDTTDLDAFHELEALREEGVLEETMRVGVASEEGPEAIIAEADLVVEGVEGVSETLRFLLQE